MLSLIEKRTGVALPTGIMFEEETTLKRLVPLIKAGGGVPKRACVVSYLSVCLMLFEIELFGFYLFGFGFLVFVFF